MILIDFTTALAISLFFIILVAIISLSVYTNSEEKKKGAEDFSIFQCPYCTRVFSDKKGSALRQCPECKSYISNEAKAK